MNRKTLLTLSLVAGTAAGTAAAYVGVRHLSSRRALAQAPSATPPSLTAVSNRAQPPEDLPIVPSFKGPRVRQIYWPFSTASSLRGKEVQRGGLVTAGLEVGPNESNSVRVSIQERGIDNVGQQLRASLWMASFLAASSLDLPLTYASFSFAPGTIAGVYNMDGYSAGASSTAGMMAALLDRKVRDDVTMTGSVNPDGTVGPVGGLRQKLLAAVREQKKEFGIPAGQYYEWDPKSHRMEDLRELADKHSIKLVEIKDVGDAYRLLTGRVLRRSEALSIELMEKKLDWMKNRAEGWQRQALDLASQSDKGLYEEVKKRSAVIDSLSRNKMYAQSYGLARDVFMFVTARVRLQERLSKLRGEAEADPQAYIDLIVPSLREAEQSWQATKQEFEVRSPTSFSEAIELIDLYAYVLDGWAVLKAVNDEMRTRSKREVSASDAAEAKGYLFAISIAEAVFDIASQEQRYRGSELPVAKRTVEFDPAALHRLAQAYTSAALANQKYYDEDVGRRNLPLWRVLAPTRTCRDVLSYAIENEGDTGIHSALASLGAAIKAYSCIAAFLAPLQSASLEYVKDENDPLKVQITDKRSFADMLMLADSKAREAARIAMDVTEEDVPLSARIWYATARMLRESEDQSEKVAALQRFWDASTRSRLAVLIRRTATVRVSPLSTVASTEPQR